MNSQTFRQDTELLSLSNGRVLTLPIVKKSGLSTGIDYDPISLTAAMVSCDGKGNVRLEALERIEGEFVQSEEIIQGLIELKERLPRGMKERSVSCLWGKNIYAAQKKFRNLAPQEMISALRLDFRKYISFDMDNSTLDYHLLGPKALPGQEVELMVTAVDTKLLSHHLNLINRAGFYPKIIDILPLSLANSHWVTANESSADLPYVIIHVGNQVCTLVIDGLHTPFYFRTIYSGSKQINDMLENQNSMTSEANTIKEEIIKSLEFYTKSNENTSYSGILLSGYSSNSHKWQDFLKTSTSLDVGPLDLAGSCGYDLGDSSGEYDVPIVLALRGQV